MFNLNRAIYGFLNRRFPEMAWRFVPRASSHLQLSPQQLQLMEEAGIYRIRLEYRTNLGCVVQRSYWTTWEKDGNFPLELGPLPRDVLLIARNALGVVEVHAGPGYDSMSTVQFQEVVKHLLKTAQDSIAYIDFLDRAANARH